MKSQRILSAMNPHNNAFSPATDYFHALFHRQTGDDVTVEGRRGGTAFTEDFTMTGTPADTIWTAEPGSVTPDGTNYILIDGNANILANAMPGNYPNGAFLIMWNMTLAAGRVADDTVNTIYNFNQSSATRGGHNIYYENTATDTIRTTKKNIGGTGIFPTLSYTGSDDAPHTLWWLIDFGTESQSMWGQGGDFGDAISLNYTGDGTLNTSIDAEFGISLLAGISAGPAISTPMNVGTVTLSMHDFWHMSFDARPSVQTLTDIIAEFDSQPWEQITALP